MKKLILCAVAIAVLFTAGQKAALAQFMIGIGYDQTSYRSGDARHGNPFDGFSAEVSHTSMLAGRVLGLNFGVGYQFNTRSDDSYALGAFKANVSSQEQYVSVPLRLVLDIPVSKSGIMLMGGGYAAFGISGIKTYEFIIEDLGRAVVSYDYLNDVITSDLSVPDTVTKDITYATNGNSLGKLDYGLQAGGGFRFGNSVAFSAIYSHGLANRYGDSGKGNLTRNGLLFRIAFLF